MAGFDLVVRGGRVATADGVRDLDVGVRGGRIAALAPGLGDGTETVEAGGLLVLPGGVDAHCHVEEARPDGTVAEESFESAGRSALAGGTTAIVCFAPHWRGSGLVERLADARARAERGALVDYAFHQIVAEAPPDLLAREVPLLAAAGVRSLKVFLTYDDLALDDAGYLRVLAAARRHGMLVAVHCENRAAIAWRAAALKAAGLEAPRHHAWSRPPAVEREATHRAIALAELVDQPVQIFHVSCGEVADEIARARARGVKVWGETCPQYLVLSAADLDRPGRGADFLCSPPPRDAAEQGRVWEAIRAGTLSTISSDHCAFSRAAKAAAGPDAPFDLIPNGIPGLCARLPLLFSEGVSKGRIDLGTFVRLSATEPARLMGLHPRKGEIAVGADADLALWDPARRVTLTNALMQHAVDATPYEGMKVVGWPVAAILRGRVAMRDGVVTARPGSGRYLPRAAYDLIRPTGRLADGFDAAPPAA